MSISTRARATSDIRDPRGEAKLLIAGGNFLKRGTITCPPTFIDVGDIETSSTLRAASSSRKLLHHNPLGQRYVHHLVYFDPSLKRRQKGAAKSTGSVLYRKQFAHMAGLRRRDLESGHDVTYRLKPRRLCQVPGETILSWQWQKAAESGAGGVLGWCVEEVILQLGPAGNRISTKNSVANQTATAVL